MRDGLLYSIVLLVLIVSCQKNPPGEILPPPTQSGEHTLGFFANGEAWIPYDRGSHEMYELPKAKFSEDGSLKISATRIDDENSSRSWFCIEIAKRCTGPGKYKLSSNDCHAPYQTFYYGNSDKKPCEIYQLDESSEHYIEITYLDKREMTISGLIEFDAISNSNDTIHFRYGRFDLRYE